MEKPSAATEQLVKLDSILDEYESSIGLPLYSADFHDPSVHKYMQMDRTSIEKLTLEECAEASLLLGSLSFHIQRSHNRELARVRWAETSIKSTTSGRENQYSGSWDSQYYQAIKDNDYTRKLLSIKKYAQQRADRLTYIASSIKNLADLFINLQKAKAGRRHE